MLETSGDLLLDLLAPEGPAGVAGGLWTRGGTGEELFPRLTGDLELSDLLILYEASLGCLFLLEFLSPLFRGIGEAAGTLILLGTLALFGTLTLLGTFSGGVTVGTLIGQPCFFLFGFIVSGNGNLRRYGIRETEKNRTRRGKKTYLD